MSKNRNFTVHKDNVYNNLSTKTSLSFPTRRQISEPIKPKGYVLFDKETDIPYYSDGVVWKPFDGETAGTNKFVFSKTLAADNIHVFNDWTILYSHIQTTTTLPKIVYIDGSFADPPEIPAGTYDLQGVVLKALHYRDGQQDNIKILDGAVIDNALYWEDLGVNFDTTNTVMTLPFSASGFNDISLVRSAFFGSPSTPPIHVTGSANIQMNKGAFQRFPYAPLITVDAGQTLFVNTSAQCIILNKNITGAGSLNLTKEPTVYFDETDQTIASITVNNPRTYEKGTPADWAGAPTPIAYKDAIDRLAAAVAALSGPIP